MLRKSVKLDKIGMRSCVASLLWQVLGSGYSSFAEKKNLVLKWAPKKNDKQIYELSNCYPWP